MEIIQGTCSCGEVISIELNADPKLCGRTDRKRPFYPDQNVEPFKVGNFIYTQDGVTTFYCRKCGGYLSDTVPEAAWGPIDAYPIRRITNPHPASFSLSGVTMHANPIIWFIVGIMALSAISSLIHMSEGLLWLNLLWAR